MPPKAKFTREEIILCALEIVRKNGEDGLTARALGKALGSSARPIFTLFDSMDEVRDAVICSAKSLYRKYVENGLKKHPAFKGVGEEYIRFSFEEPKLFQLLFMSEQEHITGVDRVLPYIEESYNEILFSIISEYNVSTPIAEKLYYHLWIYTHGIASLCATKTCRMSDKEINTLMTEVFVSLLTKFKEEK